MHVLHDSIGSLTDAATGLIPGQDFSFLLVPFHVPSAFIAPHVNCELVERLALQSSPSHEPGRVGRERPNVDWARDGACLVVIVLLQRSWVGRRALGHH